MRVSLVALLLLLPAQLAAQSLLVEYGRTSHLEQVTQPSVSAFLFHSMGRAHVIVGGGFPTEFPSSAWAFGRVGADLAVPGPSRLGVRGALSGYTLPRYMGNEGGVAELHPYVEHTLGAVALRLEGSFQYAVDAAEALVARTVTGAEGAAVWMGSLVHAGVRADVIGAEDLTTAGLFGDLLVGRGPVRASGSIGVRSHDRNPEYTVALTVALGDTPVSLAFRAFDGMGNPIYGTERRRGFSAGARIRLGGGSAVPEIGLPDPHDSGEAFVIRHDEGVSIAGDFTDWEPVRMRRDGDGYAYSTRLEPGVYRFVLLDADGEVIVPAGYPTRRDAFGGRSALIYVR